MKTHEAFAVKFAAVAKRIQAPRRCRMRPPVALEWLVKRLMNQGNIGSEKLPSGHWYPTSYGESPTNAPLDRLARTFCALEECEAWLDRCDEAEKRHVTEIERQAESKIVRLRSFAEFGGAK